MVDFNKHLAEKPKVLSIRERIQAIANIEAPSMIPQAAEAPEAPPEKEEEVIPVIDATVIPDAKKRFELARMVTRHGEIGEIIRPLDKEKKKLTESIKVVIGKYKIGKALLGDYRINYYNAPRKVLDPAKLLAAGVPITTINACYPEAASYTLRITKEDAPDDESTT